jgi:Family of unknown function (DUF6352)
VRDFWISSGHHLLDRGEGGGLLVTDSFLRAFLARPEILPPAEACAAELQLHASLLAEPRLAVAPERIAALGDPEARENWTLLLAFRDHLLASPSLEGAYLRLFREGGPRVAPLFVDQLTHLIARNALDGCTDPLVLRAAELFFRVQRVAAQEGAVLLADDEIVERHERERRPSPLLAMFGHSPVAELDILSSDTAGFYWQRSDAFDTVLDFTWGRPGRAALARAMEAWIRHLLGIATEIQPLETIEDRDWTWYLGLDSEATRIGNALWQGQRPAEDALSRVLGLFALRFEDDRQVLDRTKGKPVYLILAMNPDRAVRMKPQNLVCGLPLAPTSRAG